ncbi:ATP-dependent DNA helicase RecG [Melghirimyces profundicolus]|uniref:ATP-dependent DNA helicase RecG n=1 Tax=Melghirimyces profundicolus TaxID=1242148 RepID=A0A2T6BYU3_9BACL|nr:ATP-dependent DNA helicase RecG [Melghirimyces profundicolus]PTX61239.1 ATP-dependent DNA helicase RecG [Melghirimyces profundicolus]
MELEYTPVTAVPGVGEKRAEDLDKLGIRTVADLLGYFPYRYEDFRVVDVSEAVHDEKVTLKGTLYGSPSVRWYGKKKSRLAARMETGGVHVNVVWFNQAFLKKRLKSGETILVSGRWDAHRLQLTADRTWIGSGVNKHVGRLEPVYSVTGSIQVSWLRKTIHRAFVEFGREIREVLPAELLSAYKLPDRAKAMFFLHFPKGREEGKRARRRMAYEELFLYELKLLWHRRQAKKADRGMARRFDREKLEAFIRKLPFPLTDAQRRVTEEILADLEDESRMNRLLQGDVGSGKTVVAAIVLYANRLSGHQGALMVPTEILAEQHLRSLRDLLAPVDMNMVLLTGGMTAKEKREVLSQIQMGLADVVVGTHALFQEDVVYRKLGLVVTDEQHRFGVRQRSTLREKGEKADVLHMTATPIPRTLAITAYGDMDVSVIDEMPAGRQPVETHWVKREVWPRVVEFIGKACRNGRQAYVICPLIEESEKSDLQNAESVFAEIAETLAPIRVGLLHGRMTSAEKDGVMRSYTEGEIQVLVSTTVVEVGVNVPNATVMVIYDADRFGLAQLHQLRGRVGRGGGQSTCILVADPRSETGIERMRVMTETTDGFEIARRDLELRGPGDFFGVKQSGIPEFKVADLIEDFKILEVARADAARILGDPEWETNPEYEGLRAYLDSFEKDRPRFD